jgi:hypothetical protein
MPLYNYECLDCKKASEEIKGSPLITDELWDIMFDTKHSMNPTKKERAEACICPRCQSTNVEKTFMGCYPTWWVRGNGYLDKPGRRRDMHLYKLKNDDPYVEHRIAGEVESIENTLKKGGQHDPKTKTFA